MGYIGATELTLILPAGVSIGTNTSPFTVGEVASVIVEVSAELDAAAAAAGYAVPISPPASGGPSIGYAQMQSITKKGVGAVVLRAIFPNLPGAPGGKTSLADTYAASYEAALKMIRKGELPIVGAGSSTGGDGRELPRSYSTSNPAATAGVLPTIDLDSVF